MRRTFPRWRVRDERVLTSPEEGVAADVTLSRLAGRHPGRGVFRIWENGRAIVVSPREERRSGFRGAAATLAAEGWPVVVRASGGTAVPHSPGILQVSLALPLAGIQSLSLETAYRALGEPVRGALETLGVETDYGEVPRSFCDGRFNLVSGGRKIAGSAQRWWGGVPPTGIPGASVLAHLSLFVDADMTGATRAVNRFYALAGGSGGGFDPSAVTTVRERMHEEGGPGVADGLGLRVRDALVAYLRDRVGADVDDGSLSPPARA